MMQSITQGHAGINAEPPPPRENEVSTAIYKTKSLIVATTELSVMAKKQADLLYGERNTDQAKLCEAVPYFNNGLTGELLKSLNELEDAIDILREQVARGTI
jgi:hypothetical protein